MRKKRKKKVREERVMRSCPGVKRVRFSPLEKMSKGDEKEEKMREENVEYSNQLRVKCIGILIMKHTKYTRRIKGEENADLLQHVST